MRADVSKTRIEQGHEGSLPESATLIESCGVVGEYTHLEEKQQQVRLTSVTSSPTYVPQTIVRFAHICIRKVHIPPVAHNVMQ